MFMSYKEYHDCSEDCGLGALLFVKLIGYNHKYKHRK